MKKIGLICAAMLMGISLTACGRQSSNEASTSSKTSSSKVIKQHKNSVKKQVKKESLSSSNSASFSNNNIANSGSQQIQASSNQSQQVSQSTQQSNSNGLPPASDLHDFVNRYGESPAAYLSEHNGMSPEQAVQSVPDTMKTSGEIQDTYQIQQGQDPFN